MHCSNTASAKRGFTLIELLVVIAIIAILAAILFPVFAQARSKARQATGTSNAKQASLAILMYVQDYDEVFPRAGWDCAHFGSADDTDNSIPPGVENACGATTWENVSYPYIKNIGIFTSPGDASSNNSIGNAPDGNVSLLINDLLAHQVAVDAAGHSDLNAQQTRFANGLALASINAPADCVLLGEGHCGWDKVDDGNGQNSPQANGPSVDGSTNIHGRFHREQTLSGAQTFLVAGKSYADWGQRVTGAPFYNTFAVFAFTDGHVKALKATDSNGQPTLCGTMDWWVHMDPKQAGASGTTNSCSNAGGDGPGSQHANWD